MSMTNFLKLTSLLMALSFISGCSLFSNTYQEESRRVIDYLVSDLARHITLVPCDLVLTGTPANSRAVEPGDIIEVEITDIGRLRNQVVEGEEPRAGIGHRPTDSEEVRRIALGNDDRLPDHLPKR